MEKQSFISGKQWSIVWEVFEQYSDINKTEFVEMMEERARDTQFPFRAYYSAHAICAYLSKGNVK